MKDFIGFRFGNVHTKDLHLIVVTSSDRYEKNLLPSPKDYTVEVPGGDGNYYFGQTFDSREFTCNIAFDSVDEQTWRRISQLFSTDKLQDLVFDELPYKTYRAKLKSKPEFKFICFTDRDTGERVYKGEGTLNFVCYYPYAFGFNKYIVRAADYYLKTSPETIIKTHTRAENPYANNLIEAKDKYTKDFYNVKNNMETPWKGGYPTIEQVQAGELFFNSPDGEKSIINVRGYWENVPEWAPSSKLLTTPTLDYDQELIYLPQYSKINYVNMDTGLNNENALIGSRLLVYNPGDIPIDFRLRLDNNERSFWNRRGNHFQVRRFNVERLTIQEAVDWTGLKPYNIEDEKEYKYGRKYFKFPSFEMVDSVNSENPRYKKFIAKDLGEIHPNHTYIVEPIPKEKLGEFIRSFYWQSSRQDSNISYLDGEEMADRYEELYNLCILDEEKEELYWQTLKQLLYDGYKNQPIFNEASHDYSLEDMFYDYIYNPPEYIQTNKNLDYGIYDFNSSIFPHYYTPDYLEIKTDGIPEISENCTLYIDSEKQMLYSLNKSKQFYNYASSKNIFNDNIVKGKWFKIPPGWSLIEVAPVCDENDWGGKTWNDARAFNWGYGGDSEHEQRPIQKLFNNLYYIAAEEYLRLYGILKNGQTLEEKVSESNPNYDTSDDKIELQHEWLDSQIGFRHWYLDKIQQYQNPTTLLIKDVFAYSIYKRKEQQAEYGFLKLLHQYWRVNKTSINKKDLFNKTIFDDITNKQYKIKINEKEVYIEETNDSQNINNNVLITDNQTKEAYKLGISEGEVYISKYIEEYNLLPILIQDDTNKNIYSLEIENGKIYINDNYIYNCNGDINTENLFNKIIFDDTTNKKYKIKINEKEVYIEETNDSQNTDNDNILIIDNQTKEAYKLGINQGEVYISKYIKKYNLLPILIQDDTNKNIYSLEIENGEIYINDNYIYNCNGDINEWWWYACNYIWENFPPLYWGFADILNKAKIEYTPLFY